MRIGDQKGMTPRRVEAIRVRMLMGQTNFSEYLMWSPMVTSARPRPT